MSGHSKWSSIKHKKGAADAKRGKIFTKLIREITTAARIGGGDPESNSRLRVAVDSAKAENMPKDNIERAIKKGTGALGDSVAYEAYVYEGYGPGGVAVLVESMVFTKEKQNALGIAEGTIPEGWWIGFKVTDPDVWDKVKDGTYSMFSIEGEAIREEVPA